MTIPAIPDVIAYGLANRHVPLSDELTVVTRTNAIEIHHPDLGSLWLTTEQSVNHRDRLEQAEQDIDAAAPCEDGGTLTEPARCDCCGCAMAVGEQVATCWDERLGDVVMHAGKCPEENGDREIEIRMGPLCGSARRTVNAFVRGVWAVHETLDGLGWSVTHVPSGLALSWGIDEIDARRLLDACSARFPDARDIDRTPYDSDVGRTIREMTAEVLGG